MLFRRSLRNTFYYIFVCAAVLLFSSHVWHPQHLLAPLPDPGFIDFTELVAPVLLFIPISFMYHDSFEIELSLVCGVRTRKLFLGKFFAILIYAIVVMIGIILAYRYIPYSGSARIRIPIYIPENYKLYMIASAIVTMFFFAAFTLLLRVATRNFYVPIGINMFVYIFFTTTNTSIHSRQIDIKFGLFDPFISNYLLGDEVTKANFEGLYAHMWTANRILFFALGLVMVIISCIILNREKQHEGFGD